MWRSWKHVDPRRDTIRVVCGPGWTGRCMTTESSIPVDTLVKLDEIVRIGRRAVRRAQEKSRRLGVPDVYSINGFLHYELPSGELSRDEYVGVARDGR